MAKDRYVAYVGTYTHENSVGIHVYDVDVENGTLTERSVAPINNPSYIVRSKSGKLLYSIEDEGVASFSIDENGDLTQINSEWIGGMRGCHIEVDSKDRYLFVSGYHDGKITMMKLNKDGSIGGISCGIFHNGVSKSAVEKRMDPAVSCSRLTPDEKYLLVCDCGLSQVKVYQVDYELGKLQLIDMIRFSIDKAPRKLRFSRDGKFLYVMAEGANAVYVFSYKDTDEGPVFERIQKVSCVKDEDPMAACVGFDQDFADKYAYVSIDGTNMITVLSRDAETGFMEFEQTFPVSGEYPKSVSVIPGDKYVVSLNHDTDEMRIFEIFHDKKYALQRVAPIKVDKPNSIQIYKLV